MGALDLFDLLQRGVGVGAGDAVEDGHDAVQQLAGSLQRDEGVVKGRRGGIVGDRLESLRAAAAMPASMAGW